MSSTSAAPPSTVPLPDPVPPRPKARTRTAHALPCPTCGDVFSRVDHLSRHMRSHTQERLFVCPACDKGFIRADSLGRHCRGHCFNPDATGSTSGGNNARVTAACQRCSASKLRCDGQQPCARCRTKQAECIYVKKSRQRAKKQQQQPQPSKPFPPENGRSSQNEIFVPQGPNGLSDMNGDVQQAALQGSVRNLDFHALNALSQAAMQASSTPNNEPDRNGERMRPDPFLQSTTLSPHHPNETALPNKSSRQQSHVGQGLMPSPRLGMVQNFDGNWAAGDNFDAMNSADATMGGMTEESLETSPFSGMGFDPMLGDSFDIANWTTVDWMFVSEASAAAPFDPLGHGPDMILGGEQQLHGVGGADGHLGEQYNLNNTHEPPLAMQQQQRQQQQQQQQPARPMLESHMPNHYQTDAHAHGTARVDRTPAVVARPEKSNNENGASQSNSKKLDAERHPESWPTEWDPRKGDNAILFPDLRGTPEEIFEAENFAHVPRLSQNMYDKIVNSVTDMSKDHSMWAPFVESIPPSLEAFNSFVQLYFEYFQPTFPMLHQPSFNTGTGPWVLVLAVAAIGCRYSRIQESGKCAIALQEFLRRAIQMSLERDNSVCRRLWVAQAMVLNHLGMLYSGDRRLLELALVTKSSLITICRRNNSLQKTHNPTTIEEGTKTSALVSAWKHWRQEESIRRVGFCAWILDCQLPLYFDMGSAMTTDELQQNLPCKEAIWEASDPATWKPLFLESCQAGFPPTMHAALKGLGPKEPTKPVIGSFARLLLIHAIHQTTWVMRRQMKDPIMQSVEAFCQGGCLPALLAAANSALDVLSIPFHGGERDTRVELNTRAHIHHVNLLIDAPLKELLAFAGSQASATATTSGITEAQKDLAAWREQDNGRTARRAVLTASILFTLIRSHPSRALHEPISLLHATLTIWAYHVLSKEQTRIGASRPTFRLDKIQNGAATTSWVESGANLRGYITDVGNICGVGAGKRLLQMSCKALADMDTWSLSQGFLNVLMRLQNGPSESADQ